MYTLVARPKKSKSEKTIVTYVRVKPEEHARVIQIVSKRGYPHTIASVVSEMFSKGLAAEIAVKAKETRSTSLLKRT